MFTLYLFSFFIVGTSCGEFYSSSYMQSFSNNMMSVNGHSISLSGGTNPSITVDGKPLNLSTAGSTEHKDNYTIYKDFPNLPGFSFRFFDNGGTSVLFDQNGSLSVLGTLTNEEQADLQKKMDSINHQISTTMKQVQDNINNVMQSLNKMFSQPGWPFTG